MIISGLLLAASVLLLLYKLPRLHKLSLSHPAASDVGITIAVVAFGMLSLTFSGMLTGIVAGIALSIYYSIAPKVKMPSFTRKEKLITGETINITIGKEATITDVENFIKRYDKSQRPLTLDQLVKQIEKEQKL
jgi:hypothetical protein